MTYLIGTYSSALKKGCEELIHPLELATTLKHEVMKTYEQLEDWRAGGLTRLVCPGWQIIVLGLLPLLGGCLMFTYNFTLCARAITTSPFGWKKFSLLTERVFYLGMGALMIGIGRGINDEQSSGCRRRSPERSTGPSGRPLEVKSICHYRYYRIAYREYFCVTVGKIFRKEREEEGTELETTCDYKAITYTTTFSEDKRPEECGHTQLIVDGQLTDPPQEHVEQFALPFDHKSFGSIPADKIQGGFLTQKAFTSFNPQVTW